MLIHKTRVFDGNEFLNFFENKNNISDYFISANLYGNFEVRKKGFWGTNLGKFVRWIVPIHSKFNKDGFAFAIFRLIGHLEGSSYKVLDNNRFKLKAQYRSKIFKTSKYGKLAYHVLNGHPIIKKLPEISAKLKSNASITRKVVNKLFAVFHQPVASKEVYDNLLDSSFAITFDYVESLKHPFFETLIELSEMQLRINESWSRMKGWSNVFKNNDDFENLDLAQQELAPKIQQTFDQAVSSKIEFLSNSLTQLGKNQGSGKIYTIQIENLTQFPDVKEPILNLKSQVNDWFKKYCRLQKSFPELVVS
ncbi:MAG: hypothetical protein JHC93_01925 [Parachlamydiales bacterium]|nr:hypothetical protein [Parachlamydiales bacterium]